MKRSLCHTDITAFAADALIYSTNVQLMLSGGVGACLLARYGKSFQDDLYALLDASGRKLASVGEVFVTRTTGLPWKKVYHVVATDPFYHTDPMVVRRILTRCLAESSADSGISSIVMSALGAGYGDLGVPQFLEIVSELSEAELHLEEIAVCCDDEDFFKEFVSHRKNVRVSWTVRENFPEPASS